MYHSHCDREVCHSARMRILLIIRNKFAKQSDIYRSICVRMITFETNISGITCEMMQTTGYIRVWCNTCVRIPTRASNAMNVIPKLNDCTIRKPTFRGNINGANDIHFHQTMNSASV